MYVGEVKFSFSIIVKYTTTVKYVVGKKHDSNSVYESLHNDYEYYFSYTMVYSIVTTTVRKKILCTQLYVPLGFVDKLKGFLPLQYTFDEY